MKVEKVFQALSEPRRLRILSLVREGELSAGEIASQFEVTPPAISQHLRVLVRAGLVRDRRQGTRRLYSLRTEGFDQVRRFLEEFWDLPLKQLKLAAEQAEKKHRDD